jgi:hypothetical protein
MGLADDWSGHLSESKITEYVAQAMLGDLSIGVELNEFATLVISEIGVMHQHLLRLSQAVDEVALN